MASMALLWLLPMGQSGAPAYVARGDRVEAEFRDHRSRLHDFFVQLRTRVAREAPEFLSQFEDPPPEPVVYGYQLLPRIVDEYEAESAQPVSSFSYSWPITQAYIDGETQKLSRLRADFESARGELATDALEGMIADYRRLVRNQSTIDGYVQYNRFWQRAIALDRPRFDRQTELYGQALSGDDAMASAAAEFLGHPDVPAFVEVDRDASGRLVLHVPVYTDIRDEEFLGRAAAAIEGMWDVAESEGSFALDIAFKHLSAVDLYPDSDAPAEGDPLEMSDHVSRFPPGGGVLTTGTETTHGFVGRYVALGPGDVSVRTLAHEFGHLLGFRDGYARGYRDLGEDGFEILEWTPAFDDIMIAPRQGKVLPTHFQLILNAIE